MSRSDPRRDRLAVLARRAGAASSLDQLARPRRARSAPAAAPARGLGAAALDQPRAQRGGELLDVALPRLHRSPAGSRVSLRAKLSAAISRSAWRLVRPSVAAAAPPGPGPSAPGPSASSGTPAAAT